MAGMKPEVAAARQLFLYGAGDGRRVLSTRGLCEATGVHPQTIHKWMPKWEKEAEEIISNSSENGQALRLSAEDLQLHKSSMSALADQLTQIQWELDRHADIVADLREWARETSDLEFSMNLLDKYLRMQGSKATLRGQFLAYQKQFATLSGVVDLKDIAVVSAKELSKGRAKQTLKSEENAGAPKIVGPAAHGVFARVANSPRPEPSE